MYFWLTVSYFCNDSEPCARESKTGEHHPQASASVCVLLNLWSLATHYVQGEEARWTVEQGTVHHFLRFPLFLHGYPNHDNKPNLWGSAHGIWFH